MSERNLVEFVGDAATEVPTEMKPALQRELETVFRSVSTENRPPSAITVSRCFSGYTRDINEKIVLGVEVRYPDGAESHIVKLGQSEKVKFDHEGWQECTAGRTVSSRIFAPVRPVKLEEGRFAVLYRDAFTLFGLNREKNQPLPLQVVARWVMLDGRPKLDSVERAIAQIYTDLGVWFYPGARPDKQAAACFYSKHLGMDIAGTPPKEKEKRILPRWKEEAYRKQLRRDTVWVLCGRDKATADPKTEPARYLDPVEFVEWMLADEAKDRLPNTLVGRAHGDLHALNVLVGVRRSEAEFPAVFDYEEMKPTNVLVWDFVKLETELKVRLLPVLLYEGRERERLLAESRLQTKSAPSAAPCPPQRADRLRAFLAFEERLHDLTSRIESKEDAEPISPLCPLPTGLAKLDRLLAMLLRIRKEAAIWLGFNQPNRQHLWRDEYDFALAVAGLLNVKWDYEPPQAECALVSAGAAIAHMPSIPDRLADEINRMSKKTETHPVASYRVPLAVIHRCWSQKENHRAKDYVERLVFQASRDGADPLIVCPEAWHAIPLLAEAALIEIEAGHLPQVETLLIEFRQKALEFGDYETLGRFGRLFKENGDRWWSENPHPPFEEFRYTPGWQMYKEAQKVYEEAFRATGDYYTGINAATLALLTHDSLTAKQHAQQVADICAKMLEFSREDRLWLFATEGEAALILNDPKAITYYGQALKELIPSDSGKADSMYKQLCRLWKANVNGAESVLELFEEGKFGPRLSRSYLGRNRNAVGFEGRSAKPAT